MTDMRARYLGRWARTFAMVLSFVFLWCEPLMNVSVRRWGTLPPPPFAPRSYARNDARYGE